MRKINLTPGDRFLRLGGDESEWRVEKIIETPGVPDHVRLVNETGKRRYLTYAVSVLGDKTRFKRLEGSAQAAPSKRMETGGVTAEKGLPGIGSDGTDNQAYALPPATSWTRQTV